MNQHPSDKKLATMLKTLVKGVPVGPKRDKLERDWQSLHARMTSPQVQQTIAALWKTLSPLPDRRTPPEPDEARQTVRVLKDQGFTESAGLLFAANAPLIAPNMTEGVKVAPTVSAFKAWIKATKTSRKELERRLLTEPEMSIHPVALTWLLANATVEKLDEIILRALGTEEPALSPAIRTDDLGAVFARDKRGALLAALLRNTGLDDARLNAIATGIRNNPQAVKNVAEVLPALMGKEQTGERATAMATAIFSQVAVSNAEARQILTVALARVCTGVLIAGRKSSRTDDVLMMASEIMEQLRLSTREAPLKAKTWLFENLAEEPASPDHRLHITREGMRHLASAFEKAGEGFAAGEILHALSENLGMGVVGTTGETVVYDPIRHQDIDGGLLPGDTAVVKECGWALGETVAIRAKVRRANV